MPLTNVSPEQFCFHATLAGHPIYIMVDSGSSDNWITPNCVRRIDLTVTTTNRFFAASAFGDRLPCATFVEGLDLNIQNFVFTTPAFVLPFPTYDVILGCHWLLSLGNVVFNFARLKMVFNHNGNRIKIFGNSAQNPTAHPDATHVVLAVSSIHAPCTPSLPSADPPPSTVPRLLLTKVGRTTPRPQYTRHTRPSSLTAVLALAAPRPLAPPAATPPAVTSPEPNVKMLSPLPHLDLEDKVEVREGGNDAAQAREPRDMGQEAAP